MPDPRPVRRARAAAHRVEVQSQKVGDEVLRQMREDLEVARRQTIERLTYATKTWDVRQAQGVLAEVERQMRYWEQQSVTNLSKAMATAHALGEDMVFSSLAAGGGLEMSVRPYISTEVLRVSQETLPDLITNVSDETIAKVGRILRQGVLAQKSGFQMMQEIGRVTPNIHGTSGPFGGALLRGETIARTEIGRILNTSGFNTLHALSQSDPRFGKQWSTVIDMRTRPWHITANGQVKPVGQPFIVHGQPMMFPHDPAGGGANTINCRCTLVPVHKSWGAFGGGW